VQYGLAALKAGTITPAQFTALNAAISGLDYTGKPVAQRTAADVKALESAYGDDIVNAAAQGLRQTPIIDQRTDLDLAGAVNDIHTTEWSFAMRQRLLRSGGAGNQVIIENHATAAEATAAAIYELDAMDRWLTAIDADHSGRDLGHKVLADRPDDLGDGCYLSATTRIREALTYPSGGRCGAAYPVAANTRMAAGESLSMDVLKCSLKPLDFRAYPVTFTAEEQRQLRATFRTGVCDYDRRGVGQRRPTGTWRSYR
jgi:hypothetical protein